MPLLIILTGIFFFPMRNITDIPQAVYFIFSSGTVFSYLLYRKNKILGLMLGWVSFIFLYTILFRHTSLLQAMDGMLNSFALAGIYLTARSLKWNEDILKWFLIPAIINIIFIFIQKFFPNVIPLQSHKVCGLLGNAGLTATFLGMTTSIFLKYFKVFVPFLFLAILFCDGFVGMIAFLASWIFYNSGHNRKVWIPSFLLCLLSGIIYIFNNPSQFILRLSMWTGTLEGMIQHPFLGWGMGSFTEVMNRIPMLDSLYFGIPFNNKYYMMNHPSNEFLFGGWNFGLPFAFLMILLTFFIFKEFDGSKRMSFSILISSFITAIGFMFTPPTLFLLALNYGIYENKEET